MSRIRIGGVLCVIDSTQQLVKNFLPVWALWHFARHSSADLVAFCSSPLRTPETSPFFTCVAFVTNFWFFWSVCAAAAVKIF